MNAKGRYRMPPYPRAFLGNMVILPRVDERWNLIPDEWVLPGCTIATTKQLVKLAQQMNKILTFIRR